MSVESLLETCPLKSSRLLLVLALEAAADDEGWSSPKVDWLAERARIKPRQVQRILRDLQADGSLEVRTGRGRGRTSSYRLRLDTRAEKGVVHDTHPPRKGVVHDTLSSGKGGTGDTLSPGKGVAHATLSPGKGDIQATFSAGKGGAGDTFPPPSDSPLTPTQPDDDHHRALTPQQETERRAREIYASIGASPPDPAVIRLWEKTLGGPDPLYAVLADLAGAGHLASKSQGYVWKAVQNRALRPSRPAAGVDDRRRQQAAALARGRRAS